MAEVRVVIMIVYMGEFPAWFDLWRYSALSNSRITFMVLQDQQPDKIDHNIHFIKKSLDDINQLAQMKNRRFQCNSPYKLCDYRPLYPYLFPDLIDGSDYWGWGDLDVIYGDIYRTLESGFGRYDYISTGWNGESGPLALLRNCDMINSLWSTLQGVDEILRSSESFAMDERLFLEALWKHAECDIKFRECLHDLPAIWKDGRIFGRRSGKEYTLHHFGGHVSGSQKKIGIDSQGLLAHSLRGGAIEITKRYRMKRVFRLFDIKKVVNYFY